MQHFIIKFSDGYYLRLDGQKHYKTKDINRAYNYYTYDSAEKVMNYMKKYHEIMKDCVVVEKTKKIKLNKIG